MNLLIAPLLPDLFPLFHMNFKYIKLTRVAIHSYERELTTLMYVSCFYLYLKLWECGDWGRGQLFPVAVLLEIIEGKCGQSSHSPAGPLHSL